MLSTILALALFHVAPAAPPPGVFEVDCDAGQSLAQALRHVRNTPGATIHIRGTCVGNFVLETDAVRLEGDSPEESILESAAPNAQVAILEVRGADNVVVDRLRFRNGAAGVHFQDSFLGSVVDCEFDGNGVGIYFRHSDFGAVLDSEAHDNEVGLISDVRSAVGVQRSSFRDNHAEGLGASSYSFLSLSDTEVSGSGEGGVTARTYSEVSLWNTSLAENTGFHVFADDRSRVRIVSGVTLGSAGDATQFAVVLDDDSALGSGTQAEYHGDILISGDSYAELGNVGVHDVLRAAEFSRVVLFQTQLAMPAVCETGADLVCTGGAVAATFDCPSAASCIAPASPSTRPAPAPPAPPGLRGRFPSAGFGDTPGEREAIGDAAARREGVPDTRRRKRSP